jgi:hypothetical protein
MSTKTPLHSNLTRRVAVLDEAGASNGGADDIPTAVSVEDDVEEESALTTRQMKEYFTLIVDNLLAVKQGK